jgi:hypothetical protein
VLAFKHDLTIVIALLYGEESDWLRNLRAGGGQVVRAGRTFSVGSPQVIETRDATILSQLAPLARAYCRLADKQVTLELGGRQSGFGPRRASA